MNELTKKIKEAKNPEDPDSVELINKDLIDEVDRIISNPSNSSKYYCIENIVNPLLPDIDSAKQLLSRIGQIKNFYYLTTDTKALQLRYKRIKLESTGLEDLTETELEEYNNTLILPNMIINEIKNCSYKEIEINTTESENITKSTFDKQFGNRLIVIKNDYSLNYDTTLWQMSLNYSALYINVPSLIYNHFYENKENAKELRKFYSKKSQLKNYIENKEYKYCAIHFEEEVIINMIKAYILKNSKENESSKLIFLTGFFNSDLLSEKDKSFVIPIQEIKNLRSIGCLESFIQVTYEDLQTSENVEEIFLEPPKKAVKKDVLNNSNMEDADGNPIADANMEDNMEENMEENPDEPKKYNPFGKSWSDYNGIPRNYLQILSKLSKLQVQSPDHILSQRDSISYLTEIINSFITREEEQNAEECLIQNNEGLKEIHLIKLGD